MLKELSLFEVVPKERRTLEQTTWWNSVQRGKPVPYPFGRGIRLASDVLLLSVAVLIVVTTHAPSGTIATMELLFLGIYAFLLTARMVKHILLAVGSCLAVIGLATMLNLFFSGTWGSVGLYSLCVILPYIFPLRWSLPLAGISILALSVTDGILRFLPVALPTPNNPGTSVFNLVLAFALCWFGWTMRTQYVLVVRLHEVQAQLQEQMQHKEELATERERTRIARDIHDVLSHSLAVLSIQVQAARHLLARDPERLATKLDEMASLIRESMTESRRVVGLLREKPAISTRLDHLETDLRSIATTFSERTGIHCRFAESGTPRPISPQQRETLSLALREMLTNAHRHGAAQTIWITLCWQEASIVLEADDDGMGTQATPTNPLAEETDHSLDGHHGIQGMRERAAVLGGEVVTGLAHTGGFHIVLSLPFKPTSELSSKTGKTV